MRKYFLNRPTDQTKTILILSVLFPQPHLPFSCWWFYTLICIFLSTVACFYAFLTFLVIILSWIASLDLTARVLLKTTHITFPILSLVNWYESISSFLATLLYACIYIFMIILYHCLTTTNRSSSSFRQIFPLIC